MRSVFGISSWLVTLWVGTTACQVYDPSLLHGRGTGGNTSDDTSAGPTSTNSGGTTGETISVGGTSSTVTVTTSSGGSGGSDGGSGGTAGNPSSGPSSSSGVGGTVGSDCSQVDCCPTDDDKTDPGQCGCEVPDTDSDDDGTADCIDECIEDENKTEPGACGCGIPDDDTVDAAGCVPLDEALMHRYSFDGSGTDVFDSRSGADAAIVNAALDGSGALVLNEGGEEQYVELPSGVLSSLTNATIEAWFVWEEGPTWVRLFDFGSTVEGVAGEPGTGETFVLFTPRGPDGPDYPYATFFDGDVDTEAFCSGSAALTSGETHHVVLSLDTDNQTLTLYLDGTMACSKALLAPLSAVNDVNNWIGRSQFSTDAPFAGTIEEFRIYDIALSEQQVALSYAQGPDPAFLEDQPSPSL